jgi:hypothetical protein
MIGAASLSEPRRDPPRCDGRRLFSRLSVARMRPLTSVRDQIQRRECQCRNSGLPPFGNPFYPQYRADSTYSTADTRQDQCHG